MKNRLIDVRSASEFAAGHIPGAENIPLEGIELRAADLAGDHVVLVCKSGRRARMAAERLSAAGLQTELFPGGTEAWIAAGREVVRTQGSRWSLERQGRLVTGVLTLSGALLALFVDPAWVWFCALMGAGLTFAGSTDVCLMGMALTRMPWNQARKPQTESACSC